MLSSSAFRVPAQVLSRRARMDFEAARRRRTASLPSASTAMAADQLRALSGIWADAVADIPYYRALVANGQAPAQVRSWSDVQRIPPLTRQILQDQAAQFTRRSRTPDGFAYTAGSTGTPLRIGIDQSERDLLRIVKMAEWQRLGYERDSRLYLLWGHQHLLGTGLRGRINHARRRTLDRLLGYRRVNAYCLSEERCEQIAENLLRFRPVGIIGYAAALDLFARYTRHCRARYHALKLGFVLITTEAPPRPDTLEMLRDVFGCPIVEEYGGGEFGQVAFRRERGPFTTYHDLCYLETDGDTDNGAQSVLLTTLYHRYTPLIRYRVGDAVVEPDILPHGHVARFSAIAGRLTDVIAVSPRDSIHSLSVFHCIHRESDVYNIQMRLSDDGIDLTLVTAPGTDRAALEARIRPRLSDVHPLLGRARFKYAADVETNRAGKRRWCIDQRAQDIRCAG